MTIKLKKMLTYLSLSCCLLCIYHLKNTGGTGFFALFTEILYEVNVVEQ